MKRLVGLFIYFCYLIVLLNLVNTLPADYGYPDGVMSECPGMNHTLTISEKTKRTLGVLVFKPYSGPVFLPGFREKRCRLGASGVSCVAKYLDFTRNTVVLLSGYLDTSYSPFLRTAAALEVGQGNNVILVESFPVLFRSYPLAARSTKPLGHLLGEFLGKLSRAGLVGDRLQIVGASLGAHIGHYAALQFTNATGQVIARLTGLDPSGPCFRSLPRAERFNAAAARRVDALHTNIDGFGMPDPVGHVDFYANGGEYQPSMVSGFILPCFVICSHIHAGIYWIAAYESYGKFLAVQCESVAHARHGDCFQQSPPITNRLGSETDFSKPGIYYLPTTAEAPYFMGKEGLTKRSYGVNQYLIKASPDKDVVI